MPAPTPGVRLIGKALARAGVMPSRAVRSGRPFVVTLMGPAEYRVFPLSLIGPIIVYAFDVWPGKYEWWTRFFRRHGIKSAFFTAKGSADWFSASGFLQNAIWLPEGTDVDAFDPVLALRDRRVDVLELGRRHTAIHEVIRTPLANAGVTHLYQKAPDRVVFASRAGFVDGLGDARISICYPASDTHPEVSRGLEVMTQRYLEALAAGTLIVGRAPADLIGLVGFDPVIRLDAIAPAAHLLDILGHIEDYQAHVERGLDAVRRVGRWDDRVKQMLSALSPGYSSECPD